MGLTSIKAVFPSKSKNPMEFGVPACCGANILWLAPKLLKEKINNAFSNEENAYYDMTIVLGENFPKCVEKICKGVGVVRDINEVRKKLVPYKDNPLESLSINWNENTQTYKERKMSAGVNVTRLTENVFFMHYLYNLSDTVMKTIKESLKKGDILLAISVTGQLGGQKQKGGRVSVCEVLSRNGAKTIKSMNSVHGGYKMRLHYLKKR